MWGRAEHCEPCTTGFANCDASGLPDAGNRADALAGAGMGVGYWTRGVATEEAPAANTVTACPGNRVYITSADSTNPAVLLRRLTRAVE